MIRELLDQQIIFKQSPSAASGVLLKLRSSSNGLCDVSRASLHHADERKTTSSLLILPIATVGLSPGHTSAIHDGVAAEQAIRIFQIINRSAVASSLGRQ
jgi:hypothetical protein